MTQPIARHRDHVHVGLRGVALSGVKSGVNGLNARATLLSLPGAVKSTQLDKILFAEDESRVHHWVILGSVLKFPQSGELGTATKLRSMPSQEVTRPGWPISSSEGPQQLYKR